jgi:hypothetical protein
MLLSLHIDLVNLRQHYIKYHLKTISQFRLAGPGDGYWYVERRRGWIWIKLCWRCGDKEPRTPHQRVANKVRH